MPGLIVSQWVSKSLDHDILKFLGREHDVAEALSALDTVRHRL